MTRHRRTSRTLGEARRFIERGRTAERVGSAGEALGWYDRALASLMHSEPSNDLADVLRWKGTVHCECGDTAEADRLYRQSADIAHTVGYALGNAHALNCRGIVAERRGDLDLAEQLYREAEEAAGRAGDIRLSAMVERNLGVVASIRGQHDVALQRFGGSLRKAEEIDDHDGQCRSLNNIAMVYMAQRRYQDAEAAFSVALDLARDRGGQVVESVFPLNRNQAMLAADRLSEAERECKLALAIADRRGDRLPRAEALKLAARHAPRQGRVHRREANLRGAFDLTGAGA